MKTQYSRRELYALGEPLGESATRMEAGRRVYGGGGGVSGSLGNIASTAGNAASNFAGGSGTPFSQSSQSSPSVPSNVHPLSQTDVQQGLAGYAQPYVNTMLGATMQNLFNYDPSGNATGLKGYTPYSMNAADYVAGFSPLQQQAQQGIAGLQSPWQSGTASDVTASAIGQAMRPESFTSPYTAGAYMSPYMQNVVDTQQQQAKRQAAIQGQTQQAQAAQAGAFGGGRDAIMRAQANADLQRNLQGIQATGLQNAYTQGQQQFNTEQQNRLAGLQAAMSGAGQLGQLGTTGLQNQLSVLGAQQAAGQQQQQQQQNIINQAAQNYNTAQQYPYMQLGFMQNMLQGLPITTTSQQSYQAAPTNLQNMLALGTGAYGLNSLFGGGSGGSGGSGGGAFSGLLNQGAGLINSGLSGIKNSISNWWNGLSFADGGAVNSYATGGSVLSPNFKRYAVDHIDPRQLPLAQRNAIARGDDETADFATDEMAQDAAIRRGIAAALPAGSDVVRAAGGGILAFDKGGTTAGKIDNLIEQSMADVYKPRTAEERATGIESERSGLSKLYGDSETDPMAKEDIARREARLAEMSNQARGLAALRIAAALQKSGVNPGDRYAGAFSAAADTAEKAEAAKSAAENELSKARMSAAQARQARKDGLTDKALSLDSAAEAHTIEAKKFAAQAAGHAAQTLGGIQQANIHAAATREAAARPTDLDKQTQRVYAALLESGEPANAKTMAKAAQQAASDIGRYPGEARIEAGDVKNRLAAAEKVEIAKLQDPAWREAKKNKDTAAMKARETEMINGMMGKTSAAPAPAPSVAPQASVPSLNTWMDAARKANPGVSDADLTAYYNRTYAK